MSSSASGADAAATSNSPAFSCDVSRSVSPPVAPPAVGEVLRLMVDGWPVAVWNIQGNLYALDDICPHRGDILSEGGLARESDGSFAVVCPRHGWRFDMETGDCLHTPDRLRVWLVQYVSDGILVLACPDTHEF